MKISRFERFIYKLVPKKLLRKLLPKIKNMAFLTETIGTQTPITFDHWYTQFVDGHYDYAHWPIHKTSTVVHPYNIYCGIETSPGYSAGNYIQALGKLHVGDYTQIAPNVGIITANHDLYDNNKYLIKDVHIGKYCWIGMGAVILPGVQLGDYTIVAAGAIVTKSFSEGYCVIGGNPAKLIKPLEKDKCVDRKSEFEYRGYLKVEEI
jgi:acetyltransferase-like isoleucine patch superfamily enzyme